MLHPRASLVNTPPLGDTPNCAAPGIDVIAMLASIPTEQVVAMQQSIAKNAHRLAYLHERQYDGDDAIDVLLKGMAFGLPG
jgi:hypothetical protein